MLIARISVASLIAIFAFGSTLNAVETNTLRWRVSKISLKRETDKNDAPVVTGISINPVDAECALVGDDHLVRIYNTDIEKNVAVLEAHTDWVRAVQFDLQGEKLFSAGNDHKIMVWTRDADQRYSHRVFAEERRATTAMAVSHDNKYLVSVGFGGQLNVYEIETGQRVKQLACPSEDMRTVTFSPVENLIAAGGRSGEVRVWHLDSGEKVRDFQPHQLRIRGLEFTRDGKAVISCSEDRTIAITHVNKVIEPSRISEKLGHKLMSLSVIDADRFAVGGTNNLVTIWNIADMTRAGKLAGHVGTVSAIDCADGILVSGGYDTEIRVWNWNPTIADGNAEPRIEHPKTKFSGFSDR